jgi:putative sterol carrier protein
MHEDFEIIQNCLTVAIDSAKFYLYKTLKMYKLFKEERKMTYEEIVAKAKELLSDADTSEINESHLAYQVNVVGEGEGTFYIEYDNGKINVEPYDYKDNDACFTAKAKLLLDIVAGKANPVQSFLTGKLKVDGNIDKALLLTKFKIKE